MSRTFPATKSRLFIGAGIFLAIAAGLFLVGTQGAHSTSHNAVAAAVKSHQAAVANATAASSAASVHDVLFVGASYTAGLGATPPTDGYAYVIGREPGWQTQVNGVAGTGFLNPGPRGGQTFADRIAHLPTRPHPDLVVFQGGRNDVSYPAAQLRAAAISTADLTRKRYPGAQIVFLGPIPAHVPAPADQVAVATTLRSAAGACKAIFIDPIEQGWITPGNEQGFTGHVPAHPDNEGYAYIAKRLLTDLGALYPQHANA